jgi:hypothetical protein
VWTGSEKRTALIEFQEGRDGETSARGLGGIACAAACAVLGARRPRLGCWAGTDSRQRIAGAGPHRSTGGVATVQNALPGTVQSVNTSTAQAQGAY